MYINESPIAQDNGANGYNSADYADIDLSAVLGWVKITHKTQVLEPVGHFMLIYTEH